MTTTTVVMLILSMVLAYLFGSINFAIIITKVFAKKDIRDFGSGNAGMTNVLRTLGKGPAALTLIGDFLKGVLAVLIARLLFSFVAKQPDFFVGEYLAVFCALLGHIFPVYYGFKGGKGILVSSGALLMLAPIPFLCSLVVFLVFVKLTKTVSVGSIASAIAFPIALFLFRMAFDSPNTGMETLMASLIALLIIFMHRSNIKRLIKGEENKFGSKSK